MSTQPSAGKKPFVFNTVTSADFKRSIAWHKAAPKSSVQLAIEAKIAEVKQQKAQAGQTNSTAKRPRLSP